MHPLEPYAATQSQRDLLAKMLEQNCTPSTAARLMGLNTGTAIHQYRAVTKRAALAGYSPEHDMTRSVPDPFVIKGVSTYYNAKGEVSGQWVKSKVDDAARVRALLDTIADISKDIPRVDPVTPPSQTEAALCNLYTMTDCHIGMLAWHKEAGEDWDLDIAERTLCGAFKAMVDGAPRAHTAIINQLGDFMHYDTLEAQTPASKHALDADSRFAKMVEVTIRIYRRLVTYALEKHTHVHLMVVEGNHDPASSVLHRAWLAALYENEPRVTVDTGVLPYYIYQHGQTMLGFHHGHKRQPSAELALGFAGRNRQIWGETTKRYVHTGHHHHEVTREFAGVKFVQHPTLSASDAYAARGGWLSERQVTCYTYHRVYGQVATNTVTPEMLDAPSNENWLPKRS